MGRVNLTLDSALLAANLRQSWFQTLDSGQESASRHSSCWFLTAGLPCPFAVSSMLLDILVPAIIFLEFSTGFSDYGIPDV
jgi:hypothetical protein